MGLLTTIGSASARAFGLTRAAIKDAYFNLTTLILHGNGTNGAQNNTFLDSSSNNYTITRSGNTTQGTFSPFSQTGWSNFFNGSSDYFTFNASSSAAFGTGNFTVEFWVYRTSTADTTIIDARTGNSAIPWTVGFSSSIPYWYTGTTNQGTTTVGINAWVHIAYSRSGTTTRIFINGTQTHSFTDNTNYSSQGTGAYLGRNLGTGSPQYFPGYISNLRIVKGTALYTSAFTPSTTPLTAVTNTSLLTFQSNRFIDNSTNALTLTPSGTPSVQSFSPFAPTAAYSTSVVGGSGYFDASGDYLSGSVALTTTTTNTFSVEGWIYPRSFANIMWVVGDMSPTGATNVLSVDVSTAGAIELYWFDGVSKRCTSTSTMKVNSWNWFAIVVNAGAISIYVNSTTAGQSGTTTLTNRTTTSNFALGLNNNVLAMNGFLSNIRWSTTARTISSVPTAPYISDVDTKLLLNFTNAGITDATGKNDLETVGNAQISTTQSKFGGSSMAFDGTGDWLTVIDNPNLQMGSGDFTIEGWFYLSATGVAYGIASKGTSTTGWSVNITSGNKLQFSYTSSNLTGATTLSSATWYYFAVVRSGTATGNLKVYLNGSADATSAGAVTDNFNQTSIMYIGADRVGGSALNGYIDDLRITKGFARTISASPAAAFALQ